MAIHSSEIKDLKKGHEYFKGLFSDPGDKMSHLINTDDPDFASMNSGKYHEEISKALNKITS